MRKHIFEGKFGLERETLRIDKNGRLAQTLHPFDDENLSRDFCENQLEIITPVCNSIDVVMPSLENLDKSKLIHWRHFSQILRKFITSLHISGIS